MRFDERYRWTRRWFHAARSGLGLALALMVLAGSGVGAVEAAPLELLDPMTGKTVELVPGTGVLHVVFFATWCPACREEFPRLEQLEDRWLDRGYRLVIVAVQNRHDSARLARFVAEHDPPGELLFDAQGHAQSRWSAREVPTHLVFGADGSEVIRRDRLDGPLLQAIRDLLEPPDGGSGGGR